ncbi:MAG: 50S ribosomal protein L31 [Candidatus Spechtbacterales bacterium]
MKKDIHPTYYPKTKVKCACGSEYTVGSTLQSIEVETCSKCHPFYTGKKRGAVSGGRIERFQKRAEQKVTHRKKSEKESKRREKREK